ncbi:MFS transporter [Kitasatospora purpeofusca]|uniref:MFS transporter n=1 Tax=Kitasatospora purpeofusca TaxID=67352 RepID=UPI00225747F5|nr:MFS transporter [Kitasatospora purpeofusca]MCX4683837.1 MFS transporter [Kitasatospora purpeofusca]
MTALGRLRPTLINPTYTRLWFGQAVSSVGDAVFSTTLVLWVATVLAEGKSWGPQAVSGVVLATSAAVMFVGPFAGVFVDRWDKRATMLGTEVLRGGLVAVLTVVAFVPTRELPAGAWLALIYVIVLVLNAAGQFFTPARFSIIAELVTDEADRARAAGIAQATAQTAWIIGPPLAAPLLFAVGLQWALLFNALSYLVSYIAISSADLRPVNPARTAPTAPRTGKGAERPDKAAERPGLFKDFAEGLRFFARNRFLVALLVLTVIGQLGMGALSTLNIFFATRNLHVSAESYGYLGMALGIGGIAGALAAGRVVQWIGARRTTWIGLMASGALLVLYSRQTGFPAAVTLLFVFVVPITMLNTAMAPLLLAATPQEFRGRVISVFYPVTRLAAMLTAVLSGWLAGSGLRDFSGSVAGLRFGPIDTIFAVSGLVVVLAGVYARLGLPASEAAPTPAPAQAPGTAVPDAEPAREPAAMAVEAHGEAVGETPTEAPAEDPTGPTGPVETPEGRS